MTLENEPSQIKAAQRDPQAFQPLYERYHPIIFRFVRRRVESEAVAADITAQVFLSVLLHLKHYRITEAPFSAWLHRIALNEIRQFFRQATRVRQVVIDQRLVEQLCEEEPSERLEANYEALTQAIQTLGLDEVILLELRFFEQRPFREIGFLLSITENNAKVKTYRLLAKLRQRINLTAS